MYTFEGGVYVRMCVYTCILQTLDVTPRKIFDILLDVIVLWYFSEYFA